MLIRSTPDTSQKLAILGEAAKTDLACGTCGEGRRREPNLDQWIYPAVLPDGRTQWMLKVLQSNACAYNCAYCAQRAGRKCPRTTFQPDELADLFSQLWRAGRVGGFFLSSSINDRATRVMDRMLDTAEIVRKRHRFSGYLHLKLMPGIETDQIERAMQLAERVSVNFEAVSDAHLQKIAPMKRLKGGLVDVLKTASDLLKKNPGRYRCRGLTTQFVVGPSGERDVDLVRASLQCYRNLDLKRIYFSAHSPVPDTPLEDSTPTPLWREHRLYQADFLIRQYGFAIDDFIFDPQGGFNPNLDPKEHWAIRHPEFFPIEINTAPLEALLRVPGLGPTTAKRIVKARSFGPIRWPHELAGLGVRSKHALEYLLFDGRVRREEQLSLFALPPDAALIPIHVEPSVIHQDAPIEEIG